MKKQGATPNNPLPTNSSNTFQKILPHIIAVLIFLFVVVIFFKPLLLDNKELTQSDIVHYKGVSKELQDYRAKTGNEALWTGSMFSGMPAFQVGTLYNGNLIRYINDALLLYLPHPSGILFMACACFYILMIVIGVNPFLSIAGAIAFGLSSYNLTLLEAGHNSKLSAMAFMPLVVGGLILLFRSKYKWGVILFALGLTLEIRANHLQITYYLALALGMYVFIESIFLIRDKNFNHLFKVLSFSIGGAIVALACNTSLLWSTYTYTNQTIRGASELSSNTQSTGGLDKDYAFAWSNGKLETLTLLIPNFYGGSSNSELSSSSATAKAFEQQGASKEQASEYLKQMPIYWGSKPFTSGPFYFGAIICFLFVLGLILIKDRIKWWLLAASVLTILLSWGKNFDSFNSLFFEYLPMYNKFRTVEMILIIPQLLFSILAILTLNEIIQNKFTKEEVIRGLKISTGVTGGICLFFTLIGSGFLDFTRDTDSQFPDWLKTTLIQDRASMLKNDAWRSLAFILLASSSIWLFITDRIKSNILGAAIIILVCIDLMSVGLRYLNNDNFVPKSDYNSNFTETPVDQQILNDKSISYRVLNVAGNTFNDSRTSYYHKSIGGYSAVKLRRYQELIENQISKNNGDVIDMLNTKYLIVNAGKDRGEAVQPNPSACGNAWFVDSMKVVKNADEEMNAIGPMYNISSLAGTKIFVNAKPITNTQVGNHDKIKIDTLSFDISSVGLQLGEVDTLGIMLKPNKEGISTLTIGSKREGATDRIFTVSRNYRFNPRRVAVVDEKFTAKIKSFTSEPDSSRTIQLTSYEPNHLIYKSNSTKDGLVVFSEIYYPDGWICTVDGKEAEIIRANYVLRAMQLSPGNHTIEFKFQPKSFFVGERISMAASGLLLLLLIGFGGMSLRKKEI
jgi:hypothetical protein